MIETYSLTLSVNLSNFHQFTAISSFADCVVVIYEDKCVQKLPPESIGINWIRPRFSMMQQYQGLHALAIGLSVRIRWSSKFPHSKATIIGVGEGTEMDELFKEKKQENQQNIGQVRKSSDHKKFHNKTCNNVTRDFNF